MNQIILRACNAVGGQTALARVLTTISRQKVTQQRVNNWLSRGDRVPVELMASIERASNGKVTRKDFRPHDWDVIWPEMVDSGKRRRSTDKRG